MRTKKLSPNKKLFVLFICFAFTVFVIFPSEHLLIETVISFRPTQTPFKMNVIECSYQFLGTKSLMKPR